MKHFTTKIAFALFMAFAMGGAVQAQYQLANPGFEGTWTDNTRGAYSEKTPAGWNSFYTAKGDATSLAFLMGGQLGSLSQGSDAYRGNYSATITSTANLLGSISNGNLTLGRINMGKATPADASNYNYTDLEDQDCSYTFAGYPDSVVVWVKFFPVDLADKASLNFTLHKKFAFRDPHETTENIENYRIALAKNAEIAHTLVSGNPEWVRISTPFVYNDANLNSTENYMLASFSTNGTPGGGSGGDALTVDNIEMIYNSKLNDLKYNGTSLAGFDKETFSYEVTGEYTEGCLAGIPDGKGAKVMVSYNASNATATVQVASNDISVNMVNAHEYKVLFVTEDVDIAGQYNGRLNVSLNGNPLPETDESVYIMVDESGSTATFILKDFILNTRDDQMGVGTIRIPNIPILNEEGIIKLESSLDIDIEAGSDPEVIWNGPDLGPIPITIDATIEGEDVDVAIDIDLDGLIIGVNFQGTKDDPSSLRFVNAKKESAYIYRIDDNSIGVFGIEEGSNYQIYSHSGALIMNDKLRSTIINTERLVRGIYIMRVGERVMKFAR